MSTMTPTPRVPVRTAPEQVAEACEAISARGERPTVERVRTELGGGSPNSLTPLVREWKAGQGDRQPASPTEQSASGAETLPLPMPIRNALDGIAAALGGLTPAFSEAVADAAEAERRRARREIDVVEAGARARIDDAHAVADDERVTTDLVRQEVADREAEIAQMAIRLSEASEVTKHVEAEKSALAKDLAVAERSILDAATDVDRLRKHVADLKDQISASAEAVSTAQADAAAARGATEEVKAEAQRLRDQVADLTGRMDGTRDEIANLRTEVAVARRGEESEAKRADRAEAEILRVRAELASVPAPVAIPQAA